MLYIFRGPFSQVTKEISPNRREKKKKTNELEIIYTLTRM